MTVPQKKQSLLANMPVLLKIPELLTPEMIAILHTISSIDMDELGKTMACVDKIEANSRNLRLVENGLHDIRGVVEIQNQVKYVSDIRDSIGLVAGSIEHVKRIDEDLTYVRACVAMQPMIEDALALSVKMDAVLDLEETMDHVNMKLELVQEKFNSVEKLNKEATKSAECAANMLNELKIREKVIDEKLRKMEELQIRLEGFDVDVRFVDSGVAADSSYSKRNGSLQLKIPIGPRGEKGDSIQGERGIKGDAGIPGTATNEGKEGRPGKDGKNFAASYYGHKRELKRYGNLAKSTSFVSLDESPTMIYFKRSDALDDWTEGQPFGISHGELSINEIAGAVMLLINEKRNQHG